MKKLLTKNIFVVKRKETKQTWADGALAEQEVVLDIPAGSDLETQLRMVQLTKEDLAVVKSLQPMIIERVKEIVDRFYRNLEHEQSLIQLIEQNSSIERLKQTLTRHISEMFNGVIDQQYMEQRRRIALMHVRIGLEPKWYMCAFQDLFLSIQKVIRENVANPEAFHKAIEAVSKILNIEQQVVLEAYDNELERMRQEEEAKKHAFRKHLQDNAQELAAIAEQTNASVQELSAQASEVVSFAKHGTDAAVKAEQLSHEGKEKLETLQHQLAQLEDRMEKISGEMKALQEVSGQIREVVSVVTSVAEQTNLLALNAAIEAARAGEYGRGFAVVADEVRKLAEQTKRSVSSVSELIEKTNAQTDNVSVLLANMEELVAAGSHSMEETRSFFEEILQAVSTGNAQNRQIHRELENIAKVIEEMSHASAKTASTADELLELTEEL